MNYKAKIYLPLLGRPFPEESSVSPHGATWPRGATELWLFPEIILQYEKY